MRSVPEASPSRISLGGHRPDLPKGAARGDRSAVWPGRGRRGTPPLGAGSFGR